jgi:hypothetical protein
MTADTKSWNIRLALRREGEWWNAYLALPNTMENAKLIGSILFSAVCNNATRRQAFIDLMQEVISDAIDAALQRLRADAKDEREDWQLQVSEDKADRRANALNAKDAEIDLLKEGRKLHDELADHLEHELAAQSVLLALALVALNRLIEDWDTPSVENARRAREALAAIRAKDP